MQQLTPQSDAPDIKYSKEEMEHLEFFRKRKQQLKNARNNVFGQDIEAIWRQADDDYLPRVKSMDRVSQTTENWRTEAEFQKVFASKKWKADNKVNNPLIKIQTALSLLISQNPRAVFSAEASRFEPTQMLISELYSRLWTNPRIGFRKEFTKFVFNLAKYGWSCARRYHKKQVREDIRHIIAYNPLENTYEFSKGTQTDIDDVYFENKSPWSVWIDDMAKPDDPFSRRDWMWKEVYSLEEFKTLFKDFKNAKYVKGRRLVSSEEDRKSIQDREYQSDDLVEVYFYENVQKDLFLVEADDIVIVSTPLPYQHKQLSLVDTYWILRNTECPYGIGLPEVMRDNKNMLERFRNMTMDQTTLSIYKMFFYSGVEQMNDEDSSEEIRVEPGGGKKVLDPKNISFLEIPGPGRDAYEGISMMNKDIDNETGLTPTLEGEIEGKTAYETSQAQAAALKRLSTPLQNLKAALEWDALLAVSLMQQVYSEPKVYRTVEPALIQEFMNQVNGDPELYFVDENGQFFAKEFREFQLGLEEVAQGVFEPSEEKTFFSPKPSNLAWEGTIQIQAESLLAPSKSLDRQQKLELFNLLMPLIANPQIDPNLVRKPVKQILKVYDENPKDWLPDTWLMPAAPTTMMPQLPGMPPQGGAPQPMQGMPQMPTLGPTPGAPVTDQAQIAQEGQMGSPV